MLVFVLAPDAGGAAATTGHVVGLRPGPYEMDGGAFACRQIEQTRLALPWPCGRGRGVGQDNDGRFQAFGTMHRHHPNLVAGYLHVALDVGPGGAQPGDEALQRRRLAAFVVERPIEKFVERVVRLVTEAGKKALAASLGP